MVTQHQWQYRHPRLGRYISALKTHLKFIGPGAVAAVAYIDPGNWASCIEAGSKYGYTLLFVVLASSIAALFFQVLCSRVGTVTGYDISTLIRRELLKENHPHAKASLTFRRFILYLLYAIAEIGIISTDIAELLGTAIAINLLSSGYISLPIAILLTVTDVLVILGAFQSYPDRRVSKSAHIMEAFITILVLLTLATIATLIIRLKPDWSDTFRGFLPSKGIVSNGALFVSISILGATAMPHSYYIGGRLGAMERYEERNLVSDEYNHDTHEEITVSERTPLTQGLPQVRSDNDDDTSIFCYNIYGELRSLNFFKTHLFHSMIDIIISLLAIAMVTNASIVIFSSAAFHYGAHPPSEGVSDLFDTFNLINAYVGKSFAYIFALGLLLAGQVSSITVTLAGQIVSEGFLEWHTNPVTRRLVTRLIGIVPSFLISVLLDREGVSIALILSQVILSLCLPFTLIPLMLISSNKDLMSVRKADLEPIPTTEETTSPSSSDDQGQYISFTCNKLTEYIGWGLVLIICICNFVAVYQTFQESWS